MIRNFAKREIKEFNKFRSTFQKIICSCIVDLYLKFMYKVECKGYENIQQNLKYIVASNHVSNLDPFVVAGVLRKNPLAFMAKKELFENYFSRLIMDWCGAFSVNREKVEVSTLKTALSLKNTSWNLGIFPQGTRKKEDMFSDINKGFATLAKATKTNILPVAIIGLEQKAKFPIPFIPKNKVTIIIGEIIPYSDDIDDMLQQWITSMKNLMGSEYAKN